MLGTMPVVVVGADTPLGARVVAALAGRAGEIRAFVSDEAAGAALRERGLKVAVGDVSDASHVGAAALGCFAAVLVEACTTDGRALDFAADPAAVIDAWAGALSEAGVRRIIWLGGAAGPPPPVRRAAPEVAGVRTDLLSAEAAAAEVARLDDAATLGGA